MAVCSKEYLENRCAPTTRVPAMEKACIAWEKCMNRDPTVVGRARVSAETFAEIINSFIEPISYKTMVFPYKPLTKVILPPRCLWISIPVKLCIWSITASRSSKAVSGSTATDAHTDAEFGHDEPMEWKCSDGNSVPFGQSPTQYPPKTRQWG